MLSGKSTNVFLALVTVSQYHRGYATVRAVAQSAGRSVMATHRILRDLRDQGLVTWEEGSIGTLRPIALPVMVDVLEVRQ